MAEQHIIHPIARIISDFDSKFGIPRQSGISATLKSRIIFEPEYRLPEALHGIEGYSHIWLIWQFSENIRADWSPTVRPPRLGGNIRMGVFATRSPFRPNSMGLSCVKLEAVEADGTELVVSGADLMNGTPIFDIKPYVAYSDSKPGAVSAFAGPKWERKLQVYFPDELLEQIPLEKREGLIAVLEQDPRPAYQDSPDRIYGMSFAGFDVRFNVNEGKLTVCELVKN